MNGLYYEALDFPSTPSAYNSTNIITWDSNTSSSPELAGFTLDTPGIVVSGSTVSRVTSWSGTAGSTWRLNAVWFQSGTNNGYSFRIRFSWVSSDGNVTEPHQQGYYAPSVFFTGNLQIADELDTTHAIGVTVWPQNDCTAPLLVGMTVTYPGLRNPNNFTAATETASYHGAAGGQCYENVVFWQTGANNGNPYNIQMEFVPANPQDCLYYGSPSTYYITQDEFGIPFEYQSTSPDIDAWPTSSLGAPTLMSMVLQRPGVDTGTGTSLDEVRSYMYQQNSDYWLQVSWYQYGGNNGNLYTLRFVWLEPQLTVP